MERFGGLHVIVAVEKHGGLAGSVERFGIDEWMQRGGNDFDGFESSGAEMVGNPVGSALDVRLVFGLGTDAGDAKKFVQFGEMLVTA
jgi:hypothetical protein